MRGHHTLRMLTQYARHQGYKIDTVMPPSKKSQKNNLGRRPGSLFNIFNENEQITINTTADPSITAPASPAVVAAETAIPREQIAPP
jgi:hypothetical protein